MKHDLDRGALSRVVAVINGKGGVFKTSLVANVGGLLAEGGSRVLLVDLDPQGNLAEDLGYADQGDAAAAGGFPMFRRRTRPAGRRPEQTSMSLPAAPISMTLRHSLGPKPRRTVTLRNWPWQNCLPASRGSTTWSCSTALREMSLCRQPR